MKNNEIEFLNKLIEGLKYTGTTITSIRVFPRSEYNNETGEFEKISSTYDVDILTEDYSVAHKVISDLERYTKYDFIISSVVNKEYGYKTK